MGFGGNRGPFRIRLRHLVAKVSIVITHTCINYGVYSFGENGQLYSTRSIEFKGKLYDNEYTSRHFNLTPSMNVERSTGS